MNAACDQFNKVIIAAGSNLEDRVENCERGIAALNGSGKVTVVSQSGFYLTEPVGYADQPWFINAAMMVRTRLTPLELLRFLKQMERLSGRIASDIRNGPRVLDFDIIFFNDRVIETPELSVPHPRMQERGFVLKPLNEIAPGWIHPVFQKPVRQLLADVGECGETCIPMEALWNFKKPQVSSSPWFIRKTISCK